MDQFLVFAKTPIGDEAVRQSTRVVQRNLRMVLVQVDGKLTVAELSAKIGNARLVESALQELASEGYVAPAVEAATIWEQSKLAASGAHEEVSGLSTFGPEATPTGASAAEGHLTSVPPALGMPQQGKPWATSDADLVKFDQAGWYPDQQVAQTEHTAGVEDRPARRAGRVSGIFPIKARHVGSLAAAILVLLGLLVVFFPYGYFRPAVETALRNTLGMPVTVGDMGLNWSNRPALQLHQVAIGENRELQIREVSIPASWSLLAGGATRLPHLHLDGVRLPVTWLAGAGAWLAALGERDAPVRVRRLTLAGVRVLVAEDAIDDLTGEINFSADGALERIVLGTSDRTLRIEGIPVSQGLQLSAEGFGWRTGEKSPYVFEALQAKGALGGNRLSLSEIDTTFLGGVIKGKGQLDWSNGYLASGDFSLNRLNLQRIGEVLGNGAHIEGDISGTARVSASSPHLADLAKSIQGSLSVQVARAALEGIDFGEAARRGISSAVQIGITRFDQVTANARFNKDKLVISDLRMDASLMRIEGGATIRSNMTLEGDLSIGVHSALMPERMPVRVYGVLPDIRLGVGR